MRVECEACRALVVASFAIDGDAVRVTCSVCRHVMSVPQGLDVAVELAIGGGAGAPVHPPRCPKCGALRRGEAAACPTCGLAVARMASYREAGDAAVPETVPAAVHEAWGRATEDWSDAARHEELLQRVATTHSYAWVAGRYRARGRDPIAERQLARLRRTAEATLLASATARPGATTKPYRSTRRVLALLITTIAAGALYAMVIRDHPLPPARPWCPAAPSAGSIPARSPPPGHPISPSTGK